MGGPRVCFKFVPVAIGSEIQPSLAGEGVDSCIGCPGLLTALMNVLYSIGELKAFFGGIVGFGS